MHFEIGNLVALKILRSTTSDHLHLMGKRTIEIIIPCIGLKILELQSKQLEKILMVSRNILGRIDRDFRTAEGDLIKL